MVFGVDDGLLQRQEQDLAATRRVGHDPSAPNRDAAGRAVVRQDFETAQADLALAHDNLAASERVRETAQCGLAVEREGRRREQLAPKQAMARERGARHDERLAAERAMARERDRFEGGELLYPSATAPCIPTLLLADANRWRYSAASQPCCSWR